jgi:DNA-binding CsgD family transcriptional regulator
MLDLFFIYYIVSIVIGASALLILRWATIAFFPALRAHKPEGLSVFPLFYLTMSLSMLVAAIKDILAPESPRALGDLDESLSLRFRHTKREAEILPLLLQFMNYKEIGEALFISPGTVRTHLIHIYQKTGVASAASLVHAIEAGSLALVNGVLDKLLGRKPRWLKEGLMAAFGIRRDFRVFSIYRALRIIRIPRQCIAKTIISPHSQRHRVR